MAATLDGMDSKHEWHRADECSFVDSSLKDAQMARLVRYKYPVDCTSQSNQLILLVKVISRLY